MFEKRLEQLFESCGYWKLVLYKMVWNFSSRKFQAFLISVILYSQQAIDSWVFLAVICAYGGLNVFEKISIRKSIKD